MTDLKKLRKSVKSEAVARGIVRNVAATTGKTKATVSRTLWGQIKRPDPAVARALQDALRAMGLLESDAA